MNTLLSTNGSPQSPQVMRIGLLFTAFLLLGGTALATDYTAYYDLVNSAERKFIEHRDSSCYVEYDQAFAQYRPYVKDPYIAAQIAFSLKDEPRMLHYLSIAARYGMPITALDAASLLHKGLDARQRAVIAQVFAHATVLPPERPDLFDAVCTMCNTSDSIKMVMGTDPESNRAFESSEEDSRRFLLDSFLVHGRYINERVLGISTTAGRADFLKRTGRADPYAAYGSQGWDEIELRLKCPMNIVLHSKCFFTEHKELFAQAMRNGYLHPKDFAILAETAVLWHKGNEGGSETCAIALDPLGYYNVFQGPAQATFTSTAEGLEQVDRNRRAIHLQSYEVDGRKHQLEQQEGFAFFFDFVDRP